MSLMIEQVLKQGVAAHNGGKLQEAERLYRTILKSKPKHADANHNLGVLALSVNQPEVALPLFKTALESNPKIEQFWLSYVGTLIKENRFEEANRALKKSSKKNYLAKHVLSALGQQLSLEINNPTPPQSKLNTLLEHFQKNRYADAEELAISISQEFSNHEFSWKILGAVLKKTGRLSSSVVASEKAAALAPEDPEAHNNLGVTLKELGRLAEAEACYKKALALKVDYAEAHNNLGNTLKELGRLDEAEVGYRRALALRSNYAEAQSNLGVLLYELAQFSKAADMLEGNKERHSQSYRLKCFYGLNDRHRFYKQLRFLLEEDEINATIGSLTSRAEIRYGVKMTNVFAADPFTYVLKRDLTEKYNFKKTFVQPVARILEKKSVSYRPQDLLTKGTQTSGNVFLSNIDPIKKIEQILRVEIDKYRTRFKHSDEGFLRRWPEKFDMNGWLINMKSGGKLAPHMHEFGWLSGAVYINVPPKKEPNSGNFALCIDDEKCEEGGQENRHQIIDVVTGSLVLFPASLMHYTIPFESDDERIVLAFDVKPK